MFMKTSFFIGGLLCLLVLTGFSCSGGGLGITETTIYSVTSTGGEWNGVVGLEIDEERDRIFATYALHLHEKLPMNWQCRPEEDPCTEGIAYDYAVNLETANTNLNEGVLSNASCNKKKIPTDPFEEGLRESYFPNACDIGNAEKTQYFFSGFTRAFPNLDAFLEATTFHVYDVSDTWYVSEYNEQGEPSTWSNDYDKAIEEGDPAKSYELIFTEQ